MMFFIVMMKLISIRLILVILNVSESGYTMKIGNTEFDFDNGITYIMGILNVTPDSFSDGGRNLSTDAVLRNVSRMIQGGADIIDIGGESTRPGYNPVEEDEEINRIVPAIETIRCEYDIPISIDTTKSTVAKEAVKAGADMINDVSGLRKDKKMASVIVSTGVPCVLVESKELGDDRDLFNRIRHNIEEMVNYAKLNGIQEEKIIIDPGLGFGKTYDINMRLLNNLSIYKQYNYPVLLGASRKSFIGKSLDTEVDSRLEGTLVTSILAMEAGYEFVRVHDVVENSRALRMLRRIKFYS